MMATMMMVNFEGVEACVPLYIDHKDDPLYSIWVFNLDFYKIE